MTQMVPFWEDIFAYLRAHGFSEHDAWYGMKYAHYKYFHWNQLGTYPNALPNITEEMESAPDVWILRQLSGQIHALPKAQAVEHLLFPLRARDWGESVADILSARVADPKLSGCPEGRQAPRRGFPTGTRSPCNALRARLRRLRIARPLRRVCWHGESQRGTAFPFGTRLSPKKYCKQNLIKV